MPRSTSLCYVFRSPHTTEPPPLSHPHTGNEAATSKSNCACALGERMPCMPPAAPLHFKRSPSIFLFRSRSTGNWKVSMGFCVNSWSGPQSEIMELNAGEASSFIYHLNRVSSFWHFCRKRPVIFHCDRCASINTLPWAAPLYKFYIFL